MSSPQFQPRLLTTAILAMSADGKIADVSRSAARFSSATDQRHLETFLALVDATLFGARTLRAYGTSLSIRQPKLLEQRQQLGKSAQPVQIVCSRLANLDPQAAFFRQPFPRWLLTTPKGARNWNGLGGFEQILVTGNAEEEIKGEEIKGEEIKGEEINWTEAFDHLAALGIRRLAVMGGGTLVASLLAVGLVDEFWITICPLILGGSGAPTPVEGNGFLTAIAPRLDLLEVRTLGQEVFLHYRVVRS